jgi:2-polyprenyl-3-methyl-5-hydroxy-6-metoxy-1,4-benzoquinol methylase
MKCRHCNAPLTLPLIDLGFAPPSNAYLSTQQLQQPEKKYPLRVLVCQTCWLVQTEDFAQAHELFDADYAYFSSFSSTWLEHAKRYANDMSVRFHLSSSSHVVEIAANDGYLLQYFKAANIPCTGVEPTASTAAAARAKDIHIVQEFFGVALANRLVTQGKQADLTAANNVLAHVPDINDFVAGFTVLLKPSGVATFEFPHLMQLVESNQFDTIYHEHFSYLSLTAVQRIFAANGLAIFDVEEHPTHGGSLRVFAQRTDTGKQPVSDHVTKIIHEEDAIGIQTEKYYLAFQVHAEKVKDDFVNFLSGARRQGQTVAAYGAAAKGNTLMNFAQLGADLIQYVVDKNPAKQGKFMPGSHIPIVSPEALQSQRPDYLIILPWNIADEVKQQNTALTKLRTQFVTAVPQLEIA